MLSSLLSVLFVYVCVCVCLHSALVFYVYNSVPGIVGKCLPYCGMELSKLILKDLVENILERSLNMC